jgi:hypothetical protein
MRVCIVTVKLPRNPEHDPANKISGSCPVNGQFCTDITGAHHSFLEVADAETARKKWEGKYHITRIETC